MSARSGSRGGSGRRAREGWSRLPGGGRGGSLLAARAKVNLRLRVLGREESGFHALETLFLRLELADEVEVALSRAGLRVEVTGEEAAGVPATPANLCWRAAELCSEAAGVGSGATIRVEKRIPAGAGLGGGSADAAAVLEALNELHGRPLSRPALLELAGELGSDVPFALLGSPFALAWERGRRLLPLSPPPPRPVLLLVPRFRVATAQAYAWHDLERKAEGERAVELPDPFRLREWEELARLAWNDIEAPLFARHPELAGGKIALVAAGARIGLLCGSGSALFGVFDDEEDRETAIRALSPGPEFRLIPTRTVGA